MGIPRVHDLRKLLTKLAHLLENQNLIEDANYIREFVKKNREPLHHLYKQYRGARYHPEARSREDAHQSLKIAQKVYNLVEKFIKNHKNQQKYRVLATANTRKKPESPRKERSTSMK